MKFNWTLTPSVLRTSLVALLGLGLAAAAPADAGAATPSWNLKKTTSGDLTSGPAGNTLAFQSQDLTLKVAAFQRTTGSDLLVPAYVSWFDASNPPYNTSGYGGVGVTGAGDTDAEAALCDNTGGYDLLVFALPEGGTFVNFHLNGGGGYSGYNPTSQIVYYVGGALADGGGSAADPFSKFAGKSLATITQGWVAKSDVSSTSQDRTINIASNQGYDGAYLIILAEPNPTVGDLPDQFAVDKVVAKAPEGCQDQAAPSFIAPADRTLPSIAAQACGALVPDLLAGLTATDDCGPVTFTQSPAKNTALSGKGPHLVTVTAQDGAGHSTSKIVRLTLEDVPVVTACPGAEIVNADAQCMLAMPEVAVTAVDYCSNTLIATQLPAAGTDLDFGANTVVVTLTDDAGNTAECVTTVILADATAPTLECPAELAVSTDPDQCTATVDPGQPTANDNCDPTLLVVSGARADGGALVGTYPLGDSDLTWSAADGAGNTASCAQLVVVSDGQAPDIACPGAVTATTDPGLCTASGLDLGAAGATDNCGLSTAPTSDAPATFALGDTTVTWTASDDAANAATCAQRVTVSDDEAPTLACPDDALLVSPGDACFVATADLGAPTGRDNCAGALDYANDAVFPLGLGLSHVTWSVTDAAGNSDAAQDCVQGVRVLSGAALGFLPPLKGQPVMNQINTAAQTVPHKVRVTDCAGQPLTTGVIVLLRIEGIYDPEDGSEPIAVEDVLEEAVGRGEVVDGLAIMEHDGAGQYHFNVDTTAFAWPNTAADPAYWYRSTASVYDAATGALLGETSVDLETLLRGKAK